MTIADNPNQENAKPCRKCGGTLRWISNKNCVECLRRRVRLYKRKQSPPYRSVELLDSLLIGRQKFGDKEWAHACQLFTKAKKRFANITLSREWIAERLPLGCAKCRIPFRQHKTGFGNDCATIDQIVPRGGYTPDNAVLLCHRCNIAKGALTAAEKREWAEWEDNMLFAIYQPTPARPEEA